MKNRWKILTLGLLSLGILGACGNNKPTEKKSTEGKLSIVTTFYPMYEFTKQIVGDEADVKLLVPAGSEPHDYEPSAKDISTIQSADVFVYHNPDMEGWVTKAAKSWKKGKPAVIEGTKGMQLMESQVSEEGDKSGHAHKHGMDPHTWLAPSLAAKEVTSIKDQLDKLYPNKKKQFTTNADKYIAKLTELDKEYRTSLSKAKQKSFVAQHAAFGYLAKEYGLTQIPIAGLSPDQEPSPTRLGELKKYVQENNIKNIYFEENANNKVAKTLASEVKVELLVLNPLESLTNKQLKAGENYISVMKENLKSLEKTTNVAGKDIQPEKKQNN